MKTRTLALAALVLLVAACNEDDTPVPDTTVTGLVTSQIDSNTNDSAAPIDLNSLAVSDANTDESSSPTSVN